MVVFIGICLTIMLFMVILWFWQVSSFFSYMRKHHPEEYTAMGSPSLFTNNKPEEKFSLIQFIQSGKADELGDKDLKTRMVVLKNILYTNLGIWGFVILMGIILGSQLS